MNTPSTRTAGDRRGAEAVGADPRTFFADDAGQGEIILRTRWRRIVFIAGVAGIVVLAALLGLAAALTG